jgi:hypothetical protein
MAGDPALYSRQEEDQPGAHRYVCLLKVPIFTCCGFGSTWNRIDFGRLDPDPDSHWECGVMIQEGENDTQIK